MPYAEVTRALAQEAQMRSTAARSASPCRLSPREVSKAAPQPDVSAARCSVPPGKYRSSVPWLLAINLHVMTWVVYSQDASLLFQNFSAFHLQLYSVEMHWATGRFVFIHVYCDVDCLLLRVHVLCKNLEIHPPKKNSSVCESQNQQMFPNYAGCKEDV